MGVQSLRFFCNMVEEKCHLKLRRTYFTYSKTCVREPPSRLTLNSGWCGKSCLSYKGTCHVILLAKLHDMYLYKTTTFPHQPLRSISKVAVLHRFYCRFVNTMTLQLCTCAQYSQGYLLQIDKSCVAIIQRWPSVSLKIKENPVHDLMNCTILIIYKSWHKRPQMAEPAE